jgi:hypothetical protein
MNQETKRIILGHLNEHLEEKELNTVDLKTSGHLPVSGRWVDSLRKSVRDKDNKGFNTDKVAELLKVLELPYFMDGSQLVVKSKGESQSKARRIKSIEEIKKELKTETGEASTECEGQEECEGCEICDESEDVNECAHLNTKKGVGCFDQYSMCLDCGLYPVS